MGLRRRAGASGRDCTAGRVGAIEQTRSSCALGRGATSTEEVLRAANFGEGEFVVEEVGPVLRELSDALDRPVTGLRRLGRRLEAHPVLRFGRQAESVMAALCRFDWRGRCGARDLFCRRASNWYAEIGRALGASRS